MQTANEEKQAKYGYKAKKGEALVEVADKNLIAEMRIFVRKINQIELPQPQITSSRAAYLDFLTIWEKEDDLEYCESFYILIISRSNHVIGYSQISKGGVAGTVVDVKKILHSILACNGTGVILAHNHPSDNIQPSQADIDMTKRIKNACSYCDISCLDHIILGGKGKTFFSFADEGMLF